MESDKAAVNDHPQEERKCPAAPTSVSNAFYIRINENEIADDYPLPAYYKTSDQETDECDFFDNGQFVYDTNGPLEIHLQLDDWSLYNSDSRLISLELLPMKACGEVDGKIYGSGIMRADDGSGFSLCTDSKQPCSSTSGGQNVKEHSIYLTAIKEWMMEFEPDSSMVFTSIRTDLSWYKLGKPSKQYAPWYDPVLKTARIATYIITLLKKQRLVLVIQKNKGIVSRVSFVDVIKKLTELENDHPAYISSNPAVVERYLVVHGQIILQHFAEHPDKLLRKCAFVTSLYTKLEERQHTKFVQKKNVWVKQEKNPNPRAAMGPVVQKKKEMPATTTCFINSIWKEYYSNYSLDDLKGGENNEPEEIEVDEDTDDEETDEQNIKVLERAQEENREVLERAREHPPIREAKYEWDGASVGRTCSDELLYRRAFLYDDVLRAICVGDAVVLEDNSPEDMVPIYLVEYMFETSEARKMVHGRVVQRGSQTVLGDAANEGEVFLRNECMEFELGDVHKSVPIFVPSCSRPWSHQHRKIPNRLKILERKTTKEEKRKKWPIKFYCKRFYWPDRGAFVKIPNGTVGLGDGICYSCKMKKSEEEKKVLVVNSSKNGFVYNGIEYTIDDFVYVSLNHFGDNTKNQGTFKAGRNFWLKAFVICQLLELDVHKASGKSDPKSTQVKVRRFFRPGDVSIERAYSSDIREVYYSEQKLSLPIEAIEGWCEVRRKIDMPLLEIFDHIFFCEHIYESDKGSINQLPSSVRLSEVGASKSRMRKQKDVHNLYKQKDVSQKSCLATLDIFSGCGGLSEGLEQSGASITKWGIEYEAFAVESFCFNHPEAKIFDSNCNVILRAILEKCKDVNDCISTSETVDFTKLLSDVDISSLPLPGQVDFICGGPPCQGFSGMNRFNQSTWSKVQFEAILAFLSFADYFRPRFLLMENVRKFLSLNEGQTFRLTLASLLEMGYQVRFGILEAGAYGVSQSKKRAFIWAASPEETLPEWPEPMHVFAGPDLKISLSGNEQYAAVRNTANGAPLRAITVKDTIGNLPPVGNGQSEMVKFEVYPETWFQRRIQGDGRNLMDHIPKEMNELNLLRCQRIPKRPGADWHDLPDEKVKLHDGHLEDLIPWYLPETAKKHEKWKGLFGRLDWEGNFPTSTTDPQPMGKIGMCFHPEQDRIVTVRECARAHGFSDEYRFFGSIPQKHKQIGDAVPPPLAFALGRKLKEVVHQKKL